MKFSHFFIDRPIFAMVISIVVVIVGGLAYVGLPTAQYPEIAPPTVVVSAQYPGANAQTVAETVATPIEQQVNGVENMLYMTSQSTSDGRLTLTITFKPGTDVQTAQVLVQNRIAIALPTLPDQVRALGVVTDKASPDLLMVAHLVSPRHTRDQLYLSNYALLQVQDRLARLEGVGQVQMFGARDFSMRVWLDPDHLASMGLTPGDVVAVLRAENVQVAGGALGEQPVANPSAFETKLNLQGRLRTPEEFANVIVKNGADGRLTRLKDVARIELGAQDYSTAGMLDGDRAVAIRIAQRPGSNAVATARAIKKTMEELSKSFPDDVEYRIAYNPTEFIEESIVELNKTIFIAVGLVVLVILAFLQSWRAALVPIAAIPVSLVGTFAAMAAFGYSINNLTLFGLVLAVGIVVDDAIVVVESIERNLRAGMAPREAARRTMNEVGTALISIAIVLTSVFVPTAFLGGITGAFYRQFGITIAVATLISAFNSLTLSPALGALILRAEGHTGAGRPRDAAEQFRHWFNRGFDRLSDGYAALVSRNIRRPILMGAVYAVLIGTAAVMFARTPTGFIPAQDKGYVVIAVQLPEGASFARTEKVMEQVERIARQVPGVAHAIAFTGFSGTVRVNMTNVGSVFASLAPFEQRVPRGQSGPRIIAELRQRLSVIQDATVLVVQPPTVTGLGTSGGFQMFVEDRGGRGPQALAAATQALIARANQTPGLASVFTGFQSNNPQLFIDVDRVRAQMLHVPLQSVFDAFQMYAGAYYVNDFNLLGHTFRVMVQADSPFRMNRDALARLRTRSVTGDMVPLGSVMRVREVSGPTRVPHFNQYPAAEVSGDTARGYSSGQSLEVMERLARETLPDGFSFEWTDLAFQQKLASGSPMVVFALAVLFVFLALAAQYESWSLPFAVILIVPMCLFSAILGVALRGMDNNILTQVGFVVLIGLAAKNAILIVEFARQREEQGASRFDAAVEACRLRLRPILMTSFAFIFGVIPLATATGAASEMRQALGTAVLAGMAGVTAFGLLFTPVFYVAIRGLVSRNQVPEAAIAPASSA
jgi:HAE1 family hydrophobic/amphiphilic exporter-1